MRASCVVRAGDGSAYMLWASALFLHIHDLYSISSDLINSILSAYDQYLQEAGGDNELLIKAKAYMATVKHGQRNQHAHSIVLPSGLPHEIRQTTPEHFLVVDSGATVHCLWNAIMTAFLREQNSAINWGVGHSVCIAIGWSEGGCLSPAKLRPTDSVNPRSMLTRASPR